MADAVTTRFIYPPNFQDLPNWPGFGSERGEEGSQFSGPKRYVLHFTNISDGTGESEATKLVLANLRGVNGKIARRSVIEWIEYDIFAMDVTLSWSREPAAVTIARLPGGSHVVSGKIRGPLTDPGTGDGTDGTGNIMLSTTNHASGDSYDIRMCLRVKEQPRPGFNPEDIYLSLEGHMKCGIGKCGHCNLGPKYVCRDGPIFTYAEKIKLE